MDARLDPAKYAGLSEGDAHVIRNAGGRASDSLLSNFAQTLGTAEWFVIHHTDCGMTLSLMKSSVIYSLKVSLLHQ
jgi:carbonic anhydrase